MEKQSPYWVNNYYSLGYWLKDYAYYPRKWPLYNYMDHGMTLFDTIPPHEIDTDAPLIFKFSERLVKSYKQVSNKPVYCLMNPTIHCRRVNKIVLTADAEGTLFFPSHSTEHIDNIMDWESLLLQIKQLPVVFHPVSICLHPIDVTKGLDIFFKSKGFRVYCAGHFEAEEFAVNFYEILKKFKFTMSNLIGSYTYYSVEMGIPFSLFGKEPTYFNKSDLNVELGGYTSYKENATYRRANELFDGLNTEISNEQIQFVESELGIYDSISRFKACFLLYKAYAAHAKFLPIRKLKSLLPSIIRKPLKWLFIKKEKK